MAQKLSAGFMAELFKLVYMDLSITRIVVNHLSYQLIPKEWAGFKFLLKEATEVLKEKDKVPSLGVVSQKYADSDFVIEAVDAVQSAAKVDKEIIIDQLEAYIKDVEFQLLSKKVHDLYEEGKKEDAIRVNAEESQRILSLSLRHEAGGFQKVFSDFEKRMKRRREEEEGEVPSRVMFGLDKIDQISEGGATMEDTVLWIMRSGVGKSTVLRYHGMQAAFDGHPVLHIQLEGGARACLERYDQFWTGQKYGNIRKGVIDDKLAEKIEKAFENMKSYSKDIDVYSFEKFGQATMVDKTVRKFYGEAVVVTQEVDDIISSPVVKETIINNSDCKILLDQRKYQNKFDQIQNLLGLTDKERSQILSINLANAANRLYKEVWIGLGGTQSAVYATEVSAEEYLCYTTEETEKLELTRLTEKLGGNIELAIKQLAESKRQENK